MRFQVSRHRDRIILRTKILRSTLYRAASGLRFRVCPPRSGTFCKFYVSRRAETGRILNVHGVGAIKPSAGEHAKAISNHSREIHKAIWIPCRTCTALIWRNSSTAGPISQPFDWWTRRSQKFRRLCKIGSMARSVIIGSWIWDKTPIR